MLPMQNIFCYKNLCISTVAVYLEKDTHMNQCVQNTWSLKEGDC